MRQAALYEKGTTLRCPTCGRTITCVGIEVGALCHNNHRATQMRPIIDADSREKRTA